MVKRKPERMCACCRATYPKDQLIRIVRKGDEFFIDKTFKASGRGAYICKNPECYKNLVKTKALNRSFKMPVPEEIYQEVLKELENGQ